MKSLSLFLSDLSCSLVGINDSRKDEIGDADLEHEARFPLRQRSCLVFAALRT